MRTFAVSNRKMGHQIPRFTLLLSFFTRLTVAKVVFSHGITK